MPAREIPHPQWPTFLADFGFRHFCWSATVVRKHSDGRRQVIAANHGCFLEELATNPNGGQPQIAIVLGSPFRQFHTHVICNPKHVRLAPGDQAALEIDAADGSTMIVRVCQRDRRA
jgi:hypothetical protein